MEQYGKFCEENGNVVVDKVLDWFYEHGIQVLTDPRFSDFIAQLSSIQSTIRSPRTKSMKQVVSMAEFVTIVDNHSDARAALMRQLVIEDLPSFRDSMEDAFTSVRDDNSGNITTYIPGLSTYDVSKWSVSFCSTDGQVITLGDCEDTFTMQSVTKPIMYGITCDLIGSKEVHEYVGREPSGFGFNKIKLGPDKRPHNPLINIGAITVASLIHPTLSLSERFNTCFGKYKALGAGFTTNNVSFNNVVYLSEKQAGHRNYAIGHYLLNEGCVNAASTGNLMEILELYFQLCSIELDTTTAAVMGATLANGGKNCFTGEQVLSVNTVQNVLSLMFSCGMYEYSGEWAFEVGLPAKSGVSGLIMVVIPNVGSMAMWSPPLDHHGNSVRGLKFTSNLLSHFETHDHQCFFHPFNNRNSVMRSLQANPGTGNATMARNIMFPTRSYHSNSAVRAAHHSAQGVGGCQTGVGGCIHGVGRQLLRGLRFIR